MIKPFDLERYEALVRLLATPDPVDLPRRGLIHRYAGDPNRQAARLPMLLMEWHQERLLERDVWEPLAPAAHVQTPAPRVQTSAPRAGKSPVRREHHGLRVLRPTGTG